MICINIELHPYITTTSPLIWGACFVQGFLFLFGIVFVSVVPAHVWCLLLFSLVLLAGFLLFAPCFLLPSFCLLLLASCFLLSVVSFCFLLFAFCFMCFGQKARTVATKLLLLLLLLLL